MNLSLNFKSKKVPQLSNLRKPIFNIYKSWFLSITIFFLILIATAFIGFRTFMIVYTESYKEERRETIEDLIDVSKLKNVVDQRIDSLLKETDIPNDPSINL